MAKVLVGVRSGTVDIPKSPSDDGRTPSTTEDPAVIASRTAQMQAALDTYGVLHLEDGVYVINQIEIPTMGGLLGQSRAKTVLWAANGLNDTLIISQDQPALSARDVHYNLNFDGLDVMLPYDCTLRDCTVDGNYENQTTDGVGAHWYSNSGLIDNVDFSHTFSDGLIIERGDTQIPGGTLPLGGWQARDLLTPTRISNVRTLNCQGHGLHFMRGSDHFLENYQAMGADKSGLIVAMTPNGGAGTIQMNKVHVWGCGHNSGGDDMPGVLFQGKVYCKHLYVDTHWGHCLEISGSSGGSKIDGLLIKGSVPEWGKESVFINVPNVIIDNVSGKSEDGLNLIKIGASGDGVQLTNIWLRPGGTQAGKAITCYGNECVITGRIENALRALILGLEGSEVSGCRIDLGIKECPVGVSADIGSGNRIDLTVENATVPTPADITEIGTENTVTQRVY